MPPHARLSQMIRVLKEGPAGTDAAAEDARLLACYTSGADPEAFRRLHDRYAGLVYRVCRRGAGADAADDAYQAVWLIFARRARTVRDGRVLPGWLARVAYRVSARARRRAAAATVGSDGLHPGGAAMAAAADPNPTADPAVGAAARELVGVIERAVAGLPDHLREVVELCYLEGLGRQGVIDRLGLRPVTFDKRLRRARDLLQARLGPLGPSAQVALAVAAVGGSTLGPGAALRAATVAAAYAGRVGPLARVAFPPAVTGLARAVLSGGWGKVLALSIAGGLLAVAAAAGPGRPDTPPPGDGPASRQRTARPAPGRPPGGETDHPAGGAVDSRAYLPFSEGVPRRVTDFAEVHAASPEGVMRWAKSLSPGFVPVALGGHPSADPPQVHAVAVRLEGQSVDGEVTCGVMTVRPALEEALGRDNYRTLHVRWYRGDRRNFYDLSLWLRDPLDTLWYRPVLNEDVVGHLEGMRRQGCKPVMLSPHPDPGPHTTVVHWVGDGSRNRWRAEVDLPADRLPAWANAARADRLFVSIVEAYRNERGETRFGAVAWENPEGLDSAFEADLRTAEYEAKVAAYRRDGLRPVSVTSYGDPADPLYAAAWVRYVAH